MEISEGLANAVSFYGERCLAFLISNSKDVDLSTFESLTIGNIGSFTKDQMQNPFIMKIQSFVGIKANLLFSKPDDDLQFTHKGEEEPVVLNFTPGQRMRMLFENLRPWDIVIGKVLGKVGNYYCLQMLCFCNKLTQLQIDDLKYKIYLESDHDIEEGTVLRVAVHHCSIRDRKIFCTIDSNIVPSPYLTDILGVICYEDFPEFYKMLVRSGPKFFDPKKKLCLHMLKDIHKKLPLYRGQLLSFVDGMREIVPEEQMVSSIRERQIQEFVRFHLEKGMQQYSDGKQSVALNHFEDCLKHSSKNLDALSMKGLILLERNQYQKAHDVFISMLKINPSHDQALQHIKTCYKHLSSRVRQSSDVSEIFNISSVTMKYTNCKLAKRDLILVIFGAFNDDFSWNGIKEDGEAESSDSDMDVDEPEDHVDDLRTLLTSREKPVAEPSCDPQSSKVSSKGEKKSAPEELPATSSTNSNLKISKAIDKAIDEFEDVSQTSIPDEHKRLCDQFISSNVKSMNHRPDHKHKHSKHHHHHKKKHKSKRSSTGCLESMQSSEGEVVDSDSDETPASLSGRRRSDSSDRSKRHYRSREKSSSPELVFHSNSRDSEGHSHGTSSTSGSRRRRSRSRERHSRHSPRRRSRERHRKRHSVHTESRSPSFDPEGEFPTASYAMSDKKQAVSILQKILDDKKR